MRSPRKRSPKANMGAKRVVRAHASLPYLKPQIGLKGLGRAANAQPYQMTVRFLGWVKSGEHTRVNFGERLSPFMRSYKREVNRYPHLVTCAESRRLNSRDMELHILGSLRDRDCEARPSGPREPFQRKSGPWSCRGKPDIRVSPL